MVSKTMATALDRLNRTIEKAEARLARVPQAWSVEYDLGHSYGDWTGFAIGLRNVAGEPRLCRILREDAKRYDADPGEERPIADLPVNDRLRCAEEIQAFIYACNDEEADYAKAIDNVTDEIDAAVDQLT